jgi:hypothetical protein
MRFANVTQRHTGPVLSEARNEAELQRVVGVKPPTDGVALITFVVSLSRRLPKIAQAHVCLRVLPMLVTGNHPRKLHAHRFASTAYLPAPRVRTRSRIERLNVVIWLCCHVSKMGRRQIPMTAEIFVQCCGITNRVPLWQRPWPALGPRHLSVSRALDGGSGHPQNRNTATASHPETDFIAPASGYGLVLYQADRHAPSSRRLGGEGIPLGIGVE